MREHKRGNVAEAVSAEAYQIHLQMGLLIELLVRINIHCPPCTVLVCVCVRVCAGERYSALLPNYEKWHCRHKIELQFLFSKSLPLELISFI